MASQPESALIVQLERFINAPPEQVWPVAAGRIHEWLGFALFEPHVGGRMLIDAQMDNRYIMYGNVSVWDAPRELAMTWSELDVSKRALMAWDTLVTLTLTPQDGGTLVTLRHSGFEHLPDAEQQYRNYKQGWESLNDLEKLAQLIESAT
jgi:uncharacterized protein YndB with AHSA1/START domain